MKATLSDGTVLEGTADELRAFYAIRTPQPAPEVTATPAAVLAPKPTERTDWKAALVEVAERAKVDPLLVAEARANHSTVAEPSRRFLLCAEKGGAK